MPAKSRGKSQFDANAALSFTV